MTPPQRPDEPERDSPSEHAKVLAEVLDDQKRRKEARAASTRRGRTDTSFFVQVGLLVSATFFFYLLFFSPTWIAPDPAPPISAERTEDSLRFYLFTLARQVDAFREERGRLPDSVDELAGAKPGTEYVRLTARDYRIRYTSGDVSMLYESTQDVNEFLGDAEGAVLGIASANPSEDVS